MFPLFRRRRDFRKLLAPVGKRLRALGVRRVGFFGSFARGQERPGSDVDLLLDFDRAAQTYDHFCEAREVLQSVFKRKKLDLVTMDALSPYIGPKILETVKYVDLGN